MANTSGISRRTVLQLTGGLAAASMAGCLSVPSDTTGQSADAQSQQEASDATPMQGGHVGDGHEDGHSQADGGHDHSQAMGEPVEHATVRMVTADSGFHFEPHIVRVRPGGTVTFVNESGQHTATAYAPANGKPLRIPHGASAWDSGMLTEQGATFEHTFETEGVYDYLCTPHEAMGMIGSVVVGDPDLDDQPGMAPSQSNLPGRAPAKIEQLNEQCRMALEGGQEQAGHAEDGGHEESGHGPEGSNHQDGTHEEDGHGHDEHGHGHEDGAHGHPG